MTFDVQSMDQDQLANIAMTGGIAALEELAATGKAPAAPAAANEEAEPKEAALEEPAKAAPEPASSTNPASPDDKEHGTSVANKSGTGTIPYSVLRGARERATQLEAELNDMREQVTQLKAQASSPAASAAETAANVDEADAQIEAMREKAEQLRDEFPEMADLLTGQISVLKATRQQLLEMQRREQAEQEAAEAAEKTKVNETIQEAIDGNEVLATWQSKNGPEWAAAVDADIMLRSKPDWAAKTFSERFTKVVELVQVLHPEFKVEVPAVNTDPAPTDTSATLKAQEPASNPKPPVNSLSDIPGGIAPSTGKREQIEEMSASALGNRFMNMTHDQMMAELAALGT